MFQHLPLVLSLLEKQEFCASYFLVFLFFLVGSVRYEDAHTGTTSLQIIIGQSFHMYIPIGIALKRKKNPLPRPLKRKVILTYSPLITTVSPVL